MVLVVRESSPPTAQVKTVPQLAGVGYVAPEDLAHHLAEIEAPALVIAPLVGPTIDAKEVADILHNAGFSGLFLAVTSTIRNPSMVMEEIARAAPGLVFDLLTPEALEFLKQTGLPQPPS